jgi:DNA-binding CsgD family transcriptional regulator
MVTNLIYFSLLLITLGAATGAILIANYLRKSYPVNFMESLFYYVILMCAFGIYGIWGLIFIKIILAEVTLSENLQTMISYAIPFLGFPFLIMGWYMYLRFCYELSGSKVGRSASVSYFFFLLFFFIGLGWSIAQKSDEVITIPGIGIIYVYLVLDVFLTAWGLIFLMIKSLRISTMGLMPVRNYVMLTAIFLLLKILAAYMYYLFPAAIPVFILLFFLAVVVPMVYFYNQKDRFFIMENGRSEPSSFENLIARYGITQREREIIKEICSGKSNQEIADALFISLQTVKDHTHRIYLKMGIKRRVQLINIMQLK